MAAIIVQLECITNMHVGNGDVNYSMIDNEVERDPVTHYPTINSSGVKGSLREYFSYIDNLQGKINDIFGADKAGGNTAGKLKFMSADFLAMPLRATKGEKAYYLITTETALERFKQSCKIFLDMEKSWEMKCVTDCAAESVPLQQAIDISGKRLYIMREESYRKIELPVMARNQLDNGISKNLWYQEIVPHESMFNFAVVANECDKALLMEFKEAVEGKIIQFGGSASIGYGFCKVSMVGDRL